MAINRAAFLAAYPEFVLSSTDANKYDALDVVLAQSLKNCKLDVFGGRLDEAVLRRTAHVLARSTVSRGVRFQAAQANTAYSDSWNEIVRASAVGMRLF